MTVSKTIGAVFVVCASYCFYTGSNNAAMAFLFTYITTLFYKD